MKPEHNAFEVIKNNNLSNLRDILKTKLANVSEASFAVAFVTESGIAEISDELQQAATRGRVRFLTGLYQNATEPEALRILLHLQKNSNGRFLVRLSRERHFHRKLYLLSGRKGISAIIGSSNFTSDGLRSGGELDLMVSLPKNSQPIDELRQVFEEDWSPDSSVELSDKQIKKYEQKRSKSPPRQSNSKASEQDAVLGKKTFHREVTKGKPSKKRRGVRICANYAHWLPLLEKTTNVTWSTGEKTEPDDIQIFAISESLGEAPELEGDRRVDSVHSIWRAVTRANRNRRMKRWLVEARPKGRLDKSGTPESKVARTPKR